MEDALCRWPVSVVIPVAWGDMDALSHVNNVVYLRWFETARIAYFDRLEFTRTISKIGPILARQEIDYRRPVTYPDVIRAETTVSRLGRTSFTLDFRLHSTAQGALAAEGRGICVLFDYTRNEKVVIDRETRERIFELERGGR